jgi:hypothetical protein
MQGQGMRRTPRFPLERLKKLAAQPGGLFIQRGRALDSFETVSEAYAVAKRVIGELELTSFAQTVKLTYDVADVYGVKLEGNGWYLKVTIDESIPEVAVISFHPLERPIRTNGGMVKP